LLVESNVVPQQASTKRPVEAAVPPRHPAGERGGSGWQGNSRGRPAGQRTVDGNAWSGPEGSSPTSTDTQKPNTDCVVNAWTCVDCLTNCRNHKLPCGVELQTIFLVMVIGCANMSNSRARIDYAFTCMICSA
jgi:hypothetical protein